MFYVFFAALILVFLLTHAQVQPGLGLSESWYSWIVSIQSVGELAGAIVISLLLRWCYTKYLMLSSLALCGGGGLLYGVGKYGWMLFIGMHEHVYYFLCVQSISIDSL